MKLCSSKKLTFTVLFCLFAIYQNPINYNILIRRVLIPSFRGEVKLILIVIITLS